MKSKKPKFGKEIATPDKVPITGTTGRQLERDSVYLLFSHNTNCDMKNITILIILICTSFSSNAQMDKMTKSLNDYSFDLYSQIKSDKENLFISPLSTYCALLMAYAGAQNDTKLEFEKVLHIGNPDYLSSFKDFSKSLTSWKDTSNYLNISNTIWIHKDFVVRDNFKNNIKHNYSSDLRMVDFEQNVIAAKEINDWVTNNTMDL